jgi:hypothetical protein
LLHALEPVFEVGAHFGRRVRVVALSARDPVAETAGGPGQWAPPSSQSMVKSAGVNVFFFALRPVMTVTPP